MASINYAAREISVKIVYYGPGLSGKTTNLQVIHRKVPPEFKSDMVSLATETDRTLFFDFLPLDLGKIKGFSTKFQLYTVPGQVYYNATRKLVLRGVDGVVFVADSAPDKIQENLESFQNLEENLAEYGYKRESIPIIIQYNKRDLPNALSIEELQRHINKYNSPWSEAVANKGIGVFDSLKLIGKIVIDYLNKKYSRQPQQRPEPIAAPQEQRRPFNQDSFAQQNQQYPPVQQNQFQNFNNQGAKPQMGGAPSYQQPYGMPQQQFNPQAPNRNIPPQQQQNAQRPMMPPQQRPQATMPNQQGRAVPQQMPPAPKPLQTPPPFMQNNNFQQQQYYQQQQPQQQPMRPQQQPPTQSFSRAPQGSPPGSMGAGNNNLGMQPPQKMPPPQPMQQQFQAPQQNQFAGDPFDDQDIFEPKASMPQFEQQPNQAQNTDYYSYGSINLEPMGSNSPRQPILEPEEELLEQPQQMQQNVFQEQEAEMADFSQNQFDAGGQKTDLDMEIEKYQREIEEKQKRLRTGGGAPLPMPPQQGKNPNQYPPQQQQQPMSGHPAEENDYDVYNMEIPSYPQNQQMPRQQQAPMGEGDDAMFFTSVDPNQKKQLNKKPVVNPKLKQQQQQQQQQPQKGFLSKFFNRDAP
jgi:signal recognition particle receptor subunit beta